MRYLVCTSPWQFQMQEKTAIERRSGEVLLKIKKVGICGTDLHAYTGHQAYFSYPRILGHELAAEVLEADPNSKFAHGTKVTVMPYVSCGNCVACRAGKTNCCSNIKVLGVHTDGGMQEMIAVPENLLLDTSGLSEDSAAIVEPLAIGAHAIRRANIQGSETVVVIGCGPIGLGIIRLAQLAGALVIALDNNQKRLDYARCQLNVKHTINVKYDPIEQIAQLTNGDMAHVVIDATGNKNALEKGPEYMANGGRYVLVGLSKENLTFNHPKLHAKESTIMCSRNATTEDFSHVIDIMRNGLFPAESFITHQVDYTEMINHFDTWLKPETGVIKAMVNF